MIALGLLGALHLLIARWAAGLRKRPGRKAFAGAGAGQATSGATGWLVGGDDGGGCGDGGGGD